MSDFEAEYMRLVADHDQLDAQRRDLIADGVDPGELEVPLMPIRPDSGTDSGSTDPSEGDIRAQNG